MTTNATTTATYRTERRILRRTIRDLLSAGYTVTMYDGEEESEPILTPTAGVEYVTWDDTARGRALWNLDEFYVRARKTGAKGTFVWFIVGNGNGGHDVVTDYGVSLESIMDPILSTRRTS